MPKLSVLLINLLTCAAFAQELQPELPFEEPSDETVYGQLKLMFGEADGKPTENDFDRKGPNPNRLCFQARLSAPLDQEPIYVHRYTKIITAIEDGGGVVIPERKIVKVMVGSWTDINSFDQWEELKDDQSQLVSVYKPSGTQEINVKYTFRKMGERILFRSYGVNGADKIDAYGLCFVPAVEEEDDEEPAPSTSVIE